MQGGNIRLRARHRFSLLQVRIFKSQMVLIRMAVLRLTRPITVNVDHRISTRSRPTTVTHKYRYSSV